MLEKLFLGLMAMLGKALLKGAKPTAEDGAKAGKLESGLKSKLKKEGWE